MPPWPSTGGGAPPVEALVERLDGRADTMVELFVAVVTELAGGADRVVEKTPDHLLWVANLAPAMPATRFVAVVRDPRAVFASTARTHWGQRKAVVAATRWARDQRLLLDLVDRLAGRLILMRYEDLVADEAAAVHRLRAHVGADGAPPGDGAPPPGGAPGRRAGTAAPAPTDSGAGSSQIYRPHEAGWKGRVEGPVTAERVDAWADALEAADVARIEAVCGPLMARFGYEPHGDRTAARRLGPADRIDRARYTMRRVGHELRIRHRYAPRAGL